MSNLIEKKLIFDPYSVTDYFLFLQLNGISKLLKRAFLSERLYERGLCSQLCDEAMGDYDCVRECRRYVLER